MPCKGPSGSGGGEKHLPALMCVCARARLATGRIKFSGTRLGYSRFKGPGPLQTLVDMWQLTIQTLNQGQCLPNILGMSFWLRVLLVGGLRGNQEEIHNIIFVGGGVPKFGSLHCGQTSWIGVDVDSADVRGSGRSSASLVKSSEPGRSPRPLDHLTVGGCPFNDS